MSDATTHLLLPYILAAQAQKHVTHNEALRIVLNGATEINGSYGEISGAHVSEATALWLQTMVALIPCSG
ncbi:hypothetical protein [uncultured Paracoccus sp.]|uniref:hypothetical protein n=1 Tax=uncultured Paracoccus sp. TaxID=189685 RepID=UPI00261C057C|nr:hypothetical protein [uncultured Paracoccus sp.]